MTRVREICLTAVALLCVLCLGAALSACGEKETTPAYGYGEEGTYYYSASDGTDYMLTLSGGRYVLDLGDEGYAGMYGYGEGAIVFYEDGEEVGTGYSAEAGFGLTYGARSYLFLKYEYYTVTFTDGNSTITTQSVLNGKAATDPGDGTKEGCVFLGWYADSSFTTRYEFNTSITSDTTVYARFVEASSGAAEYEVTYDYTGDTTETINGVVYSLPEVEKSGYTFLGWWVSATNQADELTYKYTDETLCEDTTLFAVFVSGSYIGASVKDDGIYWENYNASVTEATLRGDDCTVVQSFEIQSTRGEYAYDFASLPAGKYTVEIGGGGVSETLTYVSNGLARVSGFTVISGSILMYGAVENAERYYISIECGNPSHDHTMIDNGSSLYYDFSSCDMPAEGITFTVYAAADGYYYSVSSYNYFLGLDKTEVRVEDDTVLWDAVPYAMGYEVYINGALVATTYETSWSLSGYGAVVLEIAVRPVTDGYWSEKSETYRYNKKSLASPTITGIEYYVISWTPVEGSTGYIVKIGDTETYVETTSLYLSDDNYTAGLDEYEISVKALAQDSNNDSPYGEAITVTGNSVGSAVSYSNNTVTWQYSLSASEYRITVNDGDETIVTGTNSTAITLTKSGNNEITVYFVNDEGDIYGTASLSVYAYAIVFDARGGTAYDADGNEIEAVYVAKGDTLTLPVPEYINGLAADFLGWYTLPDTTDDPDATVYQGDGYLFEDGTVFTGNATIVLYAAWVNPRMIVSLDSGMGTLTDENGNLITETAISLNGRNYTVAVPDTTDKAYVFYGWYSGENGTGTRYTDEEGNAYAPFSDENVTTLYARWIEVISFSTTTYQNRERLSVSKGEDIDLVSSVTIPETYEFEGLTWTVEYIGNNAFASCASLETINMPDTVKYIQLSNNGYDSGTGAFNGTALKNVNVYATGEPSTTREIIYYSNDGVLYWINTTTGDVELLYYPYGRTDETYAIAEYVQNDNEYELSGTAQVPAVHHVNAIGGSAFRGHDELTYMVIPEFIDTIGTYTFYNCTSLKGVEFECEIEKIEDYMFRGCTSLEEFDIPDGVKEIGMYAFYQCTSLRSIIIPDSVETMGTYCFAGCSALRNAQLSSACATINDYDFYQCTSLRAIEIPYGVTDINQYAFCQCSAMVAAVFPDSLRTIGNNAFQSCSSLLSIDLPDTLTSLGTYCFDACTSAESLHLPTGSSLSSIGNYDFRGCWMLTAVTIPANITSIGTSAFQNCYRLVEIEDRTNLGISATTSSTNGYIGYYALNVYTPAEGGSRLRTSGDYLFISDDDGAYYLVGYFGDETDLYLPETMGGNAYDVKSYAFYECETIESAVIPDCVTEIGTYAFGYDQNMLALTIGSGVKSIGSNAFYNCYRLVDIYNRSSIELTAGSSSNGGVAQYAKNIYTSTGGGSAIIESGDYKFVYDGATYYLVGYYGSETDITLPEYVNGNGYEILDYAFYHDDSITSVTIPGTVTTIGKWAFCNCSSLETMTIEEGVTKIDNYAIRSCTSLKEIVIPDSVTSLGFFIFGYCPALESATIGSGVTSITSSMFLNCASLTSVTFRGAITSIASDAFSECYALEGIALTEGLTSIGADAFYECTSLKSIVIPDTVTYIYDEAFMECTSLASVTLGSSLKSLGESAFDTCTSLTSIVLPDSLTTMGTYSFYGCTSLKEVTFGSGLTAIGDSAFYGCTALTEVIIPDTVREIGGYAFQSCSAIETLVIGSGVTAIGTYAFDGCKKVTSIVIPDSVTSLGRYAFRNCSGATTLTIGKGVTSMATYVFYGCTYLTEINYNATACADLTSASNYVFYNAGKNGTGITLTIGASVTKIPDYMFSPTTTASYAPNITSIVFEEGSLCTSIGQYAFRDVSAFTSIVLPASVTEIGQYAFNGCSGLKEIFYEGDEASWNAISVGGSNSPWTSATVYYYSENEPAADGNWWHYDDKGDPVKW